MTQEVKLPQAAPWGDHTPSDQLQRSDLLKVLSDLQNWDYRSRPMPPILREFPSMTTERLRLRLAWMTPNPSGLVVDPGGYPLLQLAREPNDRQVPVPPKKPTPSQQDQGSHGPSTVESDSPVEEAGFEPLVPPSGSLGSTSSPQRQ